MDLDETWNISVGPQCALAQNLLGEIDPGVPRNGAKLFCFFSVTMTSGLSDFYPVPISTTFEKHT